MISVAIFAHQEERRIALCLNSLPLDRDDIRFHVLVNGSRDRTVELARAIANDHTSVIVHDISKGGKSRTWNSYVHNIIDGGESHYIFMDGDATLTPGAIDALCSTLDANPAAHATSGMPMNGRQHAAYQKSLRHERGLFGDLYALSAAFVMRIRSENIRLPLDLIGDDGLIAALAKCDLHDESKYDTSQIIPCNHAGFYCEPIAAYNPTTWRIQYWRMINYSTRHFQNRIISAILRDTGPAGGSKGLPVHMSDLYPRWVPQFRPRSRPVMWWFDRIALRRMRQTIGS